MEPDDIFYILDAGANVKVDLNSVINLQKQNIFDGYNNDK